jgi:hypothetical protein
MGPAGTPQNPMTLAKDLHGPRQDVAAAGRAVTLPGQDLGDRCVSQALAGQLKDPRLLVSATGEGVQRIGLGPIPSCLQTGACVRHWDAI